MNKNKKTEIKNAIIYSIIIGGIFFAAMWSFWYFSEPIRYVQNHPPRICELKPYLIAKGRNQTIQNYTILDNGCISFGKELVCGKYRITQRNRCN